MYNVQFIFSLDVANKELKELMEQMRMPYPILQNALKHSVSFQFSELMTEKEQKEFISNMEKGYKNLDVGKFVIIQAHFKGIGHVYKEEDEPEQIAEKCSKANT